MDSILLLHGAIGSNRQFIELQKVLAPYFDVHTLNFPGHGGEPIPEQFSIPLFAHAVKDYIENNNLKSVALFGYSMGGFVALYLARLYPEIVSKIITLGTKFHWTPEIAVQEGKMLDPEVMAHKLPGFATALQERHAPSDWKEVLHKTKALLYDLGEEDQLKDPASLHIPVLLMLGDSDKMVTLEETVALYKKLHNGSLAILPATPHPIEAVDIGLLAFHLKRFGEG